MNGFLHCGAVCVLVKAIFHRLIHTDNSARTRRWLGFTRARLGGHSSFKTFRVYTDRVIRGRPQEQRGEDDLAQSPYTPENVLSNPSAGYPSKSSHLCAVVESH